MIHRLIFPAPSFFPFSAFSCTPLWSRAEEFEILEFFEPLLEKCTSLVRGNFGTYLINASIFGRLFLLLASLFLLFGEGWD